MAFVRKTFVPHWLPITLSTSADVAIWPSEAAEKSTGEHPRETAERSPDVSPIHEPAIRMNAKLTR